MRLGFGSRDWDFGLKLGEGEQTDGRMEEKEKIPHICESIGH